MFPTGAVLFRYLKFVFHFIIKKIINHGWFYIKHGFVCLLRLIIIFLKDCIYLFLERGREGERKGQKHQCVVASRAPPTRDLAHNPGRYPDWKSNQQPFGSQAGTQSTKPHQLGLFVKIKCSELIIPPMNLRWLLKKMIFQWVDGQVE